MIRNYTELSKLETYKERLEYLQLNGEVGNETFGFDRYLNQVLYNCPEWKTVRTQVIIRDDGYDLGLLGASFPHRPLVHHMNPITKEQVLNRDPIIFDPEYLITCSHETHNAIHYGTDSSQCEKYSVITRTPNDTSPWKG